MASYDMDALSSLKGYVLVAYRNVGNGRPANRTDQ